MKHRPYTRLLIWLAVWIGFVWNSAPSRAQEIRGFWADGFAEGFKTPEQVDTLLRRLREANCNAIFAQMRKGGDANYLSRYEPWAADNPQRFDALAYLIEKAHGGSPRIQVHAWINTTAVGKTHRNPFHIALAHPEYKSLSDTGEDFDNEATKIDPGHPDAADWTARVYLDVVRHYAVDGVHFDFVRYGSTDGKGRWGYNPVSVARFNARYGRTGKPEWEDPLWKQWRRDQVTALVRKVYAITHAIRPKIAVSAATITWTDGPHDGEGLTARQFWENKSAPMNRVFQDWRGWMEEGILDFNCQMSYYNERKHPDWFRHWIDWGKDNQYKRWVVPSSGIWLNPISDSFRQIEAIRAPTKRKNRARGVLLYSYAGTNTGPDGKEQNFNEAFYRALSKPSAFAMTSPFEAASEFPAIPWLEKPKSGSIQGFVLTAGTLNPVDGAKVSLKGRVSRKQTSDGTGFYAFVDLPPGSYDVQVEGPGYSRSTVRVAVQAGGTVQQDRFLGSSSVTLPRGLNEVYSLPPGTPIEFRRLQVVEGTDRFPGRLFVGDPRDGAFAQLRLSTTPLLPFQADDLIAVSGMVADVDGERVIRADAIRWLGVSLWQFWLPTGIAQPINGRGLEVWGVGVYLDVSLRGAVREVAGDRLILDDPYGTEVMLTGRKDVGVEDPEAPLMAPSVGSRISVAGIATVNHRDGGPMLIRFRPASQEQIRILTDAASITLRRFVLLVGVLLAAGTSWLVWSRRTKSSQATSGQTS